MFKSLLGEYPGVHLIQVLRVSILICVLASASPFSSSSQCQEKLYVYEAEPPLSLDPYASHDDVSKRLISLFCRPLFRFEYTLSSGEDAYEPVLARGFRRVGSNRLEVTIRDDAFFYRRSRDELGVAFIDSVRVTAGDVVANYKCLTNEKSVIADSRPRDRLKPVVQDMREISEKVLEVTFQSDYRDKLHPPTQVLDFPVVPRAALPAGSVLERSPSANSKTSQYRKQPWGSGPYYLFDKNERGGSTVWEFRKSRPAPISFIQTIDVKVLPYHLFKAAVTIPQEQKYECFPSVPLGMRSEVGKGLKVKDLFNPKIAEVLFNTRTEPLDDIRVRRALSMYIDRNKLADLLLNEVNLINGPMPYGYVYYCSQCSTPFHSYNVAIADSLLRDAGWIKDELGGGFWVKDGVVLQVDLIGCAGSVQSATALIIEAVAGAWKENGIRSSAHTLLPVEYRKRLMQTTQDFQAAYHEITYGIVPEINRHFCSYGSENYSGLDSPVVDSLWRALRTVPLANLKSTYHMLHSTISDLAPCAFLWSPKEYAAYSLSVKVDQDWLTYNFLAKMEYWQVEM